MAAQSTHSKPDSRVDTYLARHPDWDTQLTALRALLLKVGMEESIKWGGPAYSHAGRLVASLAGFKQHCALWLHQGVFLADPENVLINAQQGKTRAMRHWRFEAGDVVPKRLVTRYLKEAMANAAAGKQIKPRKAAAQSIPAELAAALDSNKALKRAFAELTPGRQREYAVYIDSAKRDTTRASRLAKIKPMIRQGIGLNSMYQKR